MGRKGRKEKQVDAVLPPRDPLVVYNSRLIPVDICDLWQGNAAFLVLGGPSVNNYPPEVFAERGVLSLGVNNVCGKIRCTAFVCSDPPNKFHHGIWFDGKCLKFVPRAKAASGRSRIRMKTDGRFTWAPVTIRQCPSVFFFDRAEDLRPELFLTTPKAYWGTGLDASKVTKRRRLLFTPLLCLRILHFLGVREVYCLGLDFKMSGAEKYCFNEKRDEAAIRSNNSLYRNANLELADIKPALDAAGFRVYNCGASSGCPVFPFVPFETALRRVRGAVPTEPFDLADWYATKDYEGTLDEITVKQAADAESKKPKIQGCVDRERRQRR